jgi:hypothetical protein
MVVLCDMNLEPDCVSYRAVSLDGIASVVPWVERGKGMNDRTSGVVISCPTNGKSCPRVPLNAFSILECLCLGLELADGRPQPAAHQWCANMAAKSWTHVSSFPENVQQWSRREEIRF